MSDVTLSSSRPQLPLAQRPYYRVLVRGDARDLEHGFQLHELDQQALMRPLTKAAYRIDSYDEVAETIYRAWRTALEGEPGPVFVEVPANLQLLTGEVGSMPDANIALDRPALDEGKIGEAAALLAAADKPGLFVGWGAKDVTADLVRIADHLGAPVATTSSILRLAISADNPASIISRLPPPPQHSV